MLYYRQHIRFIIPIRYLLLTKAATGKTPVGRLMPMLEDVMEVMYWVADREATAGIGC